MKTPQNVIGGLTWCLVLYIYSPNKFVTWIIPTLLVGLTRKLNLIDDEVDQRMHKFYWELQVSQKAEHAGEWDDCFQRLTTSLIFNTLNYLIITDWGLREVNREPLNCHGSWLVILERLESSFLSIEARPNEAIPTRRRRRVNLEVKC